MFTSFILILCVITTMEGQQHALVLFTHKNTDDDPTCTVKGIFPTKEEAISAGELWAQEEEKKGDVYDVYYNAFPTNYKASSELKFPTLFTGFVHFHPTKDAADVTIKKGLHTSLNPYDNSHEW